VVLAAIDVGFAVTKLIERAGIYKIISKRDLPFCGIWEIAN